MVERVMLKECVQEEVEFGEFMYVIGNIPLGSNFSPDRNRDLQQHQSNNSKPYIQR
jgi:hypothetical protein